MCSYCFSLTPYQDYDYTTTAENRLSNPKDVTEHCKLGVQNIVDQLKKLKKDGKYTLDQVKAYLIVSDIPYIIYSRVCRQTSY